MNINRTEVTLSERDFATCTVCAFPVNVAAGFRRAHSPSGRRLTRRELFDTVVTRKTHPLANTLKPEDIVRPTIAVKLSFATRPSILAEKVA